MKFMRASFAAGLMLAGLVVWPVDAQQQTDSMSTRRARQQKELQTRVFQVGNMELREAHEAVGRLFNSHNVAVLERTNSLVVRDTPEVLDQIAGLLEQLKQQKPEDPAMELIQVVSLRHRDPGMISELLDELFHDTHIMPDHDSGQIVLKSDNAPEIAEILRMIEALDVSATGPPQRQVKTLAVTVDFIRGTFGGTSEGDLPESLEGVGAALRKSGLGDLSVYGHLMVRTQEGEEFQSKGVVRSSAQTDAAAFIKISGRVQLIDDRAQLYIESHLRIPITVQRGRDNAGETLLKLNYEELNLGTTTTVPLGDYFVLGAIPASTGDSDTILMVIHITAE